jgi:hypothetical protein
MQFQPECTDNGRRRARVHLGLEIVTGSRALYGNEDSRCGYIFSPLYGLNHRGLAVRHIGTKARRRGSTSRVLGEQLPDPQVRVNPNLHD